MGNVQHPRQGQGTQTNLFFFVFFSVLCFDKSLFSSFCLLMSTVERTEEGTTQPKRNQEYYRLFAVGTWRRHGAVPMLYRHPG